MAFVGEPVCFNEFHLVACSLEVSGKEGSYSYPTQSISWVWAVGAGSRVTNLDFLSFSTGRPTSWEPPQPSVNWGGWSSWPWKARRWMVWYWWVLRDILTWGLLETCTILPHPVMLMGEWFYFDFDWKAMKWGEMEVFLLSEPKRRCLGDALVKNYYH